MSEAYNTYLKNIERANNFITLYEEATKNRGSGRRDTLTTDILRAGVVFLHSTLEDYLRALLLSKKLEMLHSNENNFKSVLKNVSLNGENRGRQDGVKYKLADLWNEKDKKIIDIAEEALRDRASLLTFNDYTQIMCSLQEVGIRLTKNCNPDGIIDTYIKRRHKIVHEADNNAMHGSGHYRASSINAKVLAAWIKAVESLVKEIENQLQ